MTAVKFANISHPNATFSNCFMDHKSWEEADPDVRNTYLSHSSLKVDLEQEFF